MIVLKNILIISIVFLLGSNLYSQITDNRLLIIIGNTTVDTSQITISKSEFLKPGKIVTNQKGWSVDSYNFSMFALGNSIKCEVKDSMYNSKLREAVLNEKINYRYINIEEIKIIDREGNVSRPTVETVKVKFIYK